MLIKRFEGASIQEVLREVRAELGPDAIVLSQRSRPAPRSWLGVRGQAVVEVTAAVDREQTQAPAPHAGEGVSPVSRTRGDESWRPLQLTRALIEPLEDEIRSLRAAIHEQPAPPQQTSLAAEVAEIRALVEQLLYCSRHSELWQTLEGSKEGIVLQLGPLGPLAAAATETRGDQRSADRFLECKRRKRV